MAALFSDPGERRFAKVLHVVDLECHWRSYYLDFILVILKLQGGTKKWRNLAFFQTVPANFLLSRPNAAEYCNSEKNSLSTEGCCTRNATFRELWPTNLWDLPAPLLFLKTKRLQHVLFPFAIWQHCWYCCNVGFDTCIRRTRLFLSRVSILTRDILI